MNQNNETHLRAHIVEWERSRKQLLAKASNADFAIYKKELDISTNKQIEHIQKQTAREKCRLKKQYASKQSMLEKSAQLVVFETAYNAAINNCLMQLKKKGAQTNEFFAHLVTAYDAKEVHVPKHITLAGTKADQTSLSISVKTKEPVEIDVANYINDNNEYIVESIRACMK
jgi:hypothetical protein